MAFVKGGRKTKYGQPLTKRIPVLFTDEQSAVIEEKFSSDPVLENQEVSDYMRELLLRDIGVLPPMPGEFPGSHLVGEASVSLPIIGTTHGGPGTEVIPDGTTTVGLTQSMMDLFGAEPGDRFVRVQYDSMAEVGIVDGSLVLMHWLKEHELPRRGEIALIQMENEGGDYKTTLKRWAGSGQEWRPKLEDGAGNTFEIPEGYKAKPIMVARASILVL